MRVAKLRHGSCFTQKPLGDVAVRSELAFDDFYGDWTFQSKVRSKVDRAHATGADFTFNPESTGYELRDIHT
jgi:hypothetical protein